MLRWRIAAVGVLVLLASALFVVSSLASNAQMYFSSDTAGQNRVTAIQEGSSIWICVYDQDLNVSYDLRDKVWCDLKVFDPKTGAYIVWDNGGYTGKNGDLNKDYLEETGADTGLFVSKRPFQVGTREDYAVPQWSTHLVGPYHHSLGLTLTDFQWGNYDFLDPFALTKSETNIDGSTRFSVWKGAPLNRFSFMPGVMPGLDLPVLPSDPLLFLSYVVGRFENMDTLVGMFQDPLEDTDVAICLGKITDNQSRVTWDQPFYKDPREAAAITITDPDENLDCSRVEYVPVFVIVNPGSWNPVNSGSLPTLSTGDSPANFCQLKRTGGVAGNDKATMAAMPALIGPAYNSIRWYNIYNAEKNFKASVGPSTGVANGRYYMQYPVKAVASVLGWENVTYFDTVSANGVTAVSFYAQETGANTGVFRLNLNNILTDLGFTNLRVGDTLVAYYLDPNDEDDFQLAPAYIGDVERSSVAFTDANRQPKDVYWLGRDSIYVQATDENANVQACCPEQVVVHICDPHEEDDAEWWILDETGSNSGIFFSNAGMELLPVWSALGESLPGLTGGYQLQLDNWKLEAFNEDSVYVRYNDVYYTNNMVGMLGLGDSDTTTAFSGPRLDRVRVANDVSFDLMKIGDTQVVDPITAKPTMYFLDREGHRVDGYVSSDCVFVEVIDPDQNEDNLRRERVDGYWDGGQNTPFGPMALNTFGCGYSWTLTNPINALLGDTNIFNDSRVLIGSLHQLEVRGITTDGITTMDGVDHAGYASWPRLYFLNPRNGRWAAVDVLETTATSADFRSVVCVPLTSLYACVPSLGALPNDTILAAYTDPSNHSDTAWISIKVGRGGAGATGGGSTTTFSDAVGAAVTRYTDADTVYVTVTDPSHAGDPAILGAVKIGAKTYDLAPLAGVTNGFITPAITMSDTGVSVPGTITATYTDPMDATDTSTATVNVVASVLAVTEFYAKPNPFSTSTVFTFKGTGVPTTFSVTTFAPGTGQTLWSCMESGKTEVVWNGRTSDGQIVANGPYVYVAVLAGTNGTLPPFRGTVYVDR